MPLLPLLPLLLLSSIITLPLHHMHASMNHDLQWVIQFVISWFIIIIFIICWSNSLCIFVHSQTRNDATQVHEHTYLNRYTYIKLHGRKRFNLCLVFPMLLMVKLLYMLSYLQMLCCYFTNVQWINVNLKDNMEWLYTFNLNHYKCAVIRIRALLTYKHYNFNIKFIFSPCLLVTFRFILSSCLFHFRVYGRFRYFFYYILCVYEIRYVSVLFNLLFITDV